MTESELAEHEGHIFRLAIAGGQYQRDGSPDDLFCIRGLFVAIEWKAPGQKARPNQIQVRDEIIASGGIAGIVDSWEGLEALVSGIEAVQLGMT